MNYQRGKKDRKLSQNCPHSTVSCGAYRNGTGSVCLRLVSHNEVKSFQNGSKIRAAAIDFQQARLPQHHSKSAATAANSNDKYALALPKNYFQPCIEGDFLTGHL